MNKSNCDRLLERIKELESIPLYDVSGGRQRSSGENESLAKLRIIHKERCNGNK